MSEHETRHRALFELTPHPVFVVDEDSHRIVDANRAAREVYGYTHAELECMKIEQLCVSEADSAVPLASEDFTPAGAERESLRHRTKDGRLFEVEVSSFVAELDGRRVRLAAIRDVRALRHAERALRWQDEQLRALADHLPVILARFDRQYRHVYVNRQAERVTGVAAADFIGQTNGDLGMPEDRVRYWRQRLDEVFESGEPTSLEFSFRAADGTERWFESMLVPEWSGEGRVEHVLCISSDITDRKRMDERLRQAQRMESIGRLAGGVAHDFNNLLTIVLGSASMARKHWAAGESPEEMLDQIHHAAERAAALTGQLLSFARRQVVEPRVVELDEAVREVEGMLRGLVGEDLALLSDLDPGTGAVCIDPGQLEQVLVNLVLNARDACSPGGRIRIATANARLGDRSDPPGPALPPGTYALLQVSDTGHGISPQLVHHIFEPFFTTKGRPKGTGLGLATAYGIIKQAGGEITVDTQPGVGSAFRVYLPIADARPQRAVTPQTKGDVGGDETILLVEDDPVIRLICWQSLLDAGYTVFAARDAEEAVSLADEKQKLDLLVTDVVLPGRNGVELAELLQARRPSMRVLFVSGFAGTQIPLGGGRAYLQKPFSAGALPAKVRELLDERGDG